MYSWTEAAEEKKDCLKCSQHVPGHCQGDPSLRSSAKPKHRYILGSSPLGKLFSHVSMCICQLAHPVIQFSLKNNNAVTHTLCRQKEMGSPLLLPLVGFFATLAADMQEG